jgi:hypothetical protein
MVAIEVDLALKREGDTFFSPPDTCGVLGGASFSCPEYCQEWTTIVICFSKSKYQRGVGESMPYHFSFIERKTKRITHLSYTQQNIPN